MKPERCWGKASASYLRYQAGVLTEEDEVIESDDPSVFTGKDEVRATPRTKVKKHSKMPRPAKNCAEIPHAEAWEIIVPSNTGDTREEAAANYARRQSERAQAKAACNRRRYHDWRMFMSTWEGHPSRHYVCIDCGKMH